MNVIFYGINGAMGKVFEKTASEFDDIRIVCGIDINDASEGHAFPVRKSFDEMTESADCLIDFSFHSCVADYLTLAIRRKLPCVIATTGFAPAEQNMIEFASKRIPIFQSPNMSLGANCFMRIVRRATESLGGIADIGIVERHHGRKKDAPSGTAKMLAETVSAALASRADRAARATAPPIASVRGGTIVGKHEVSFMMDNEVITLTHEAESRKIFALGAIRAARFIANKEPRLYSMDDLLP